MDPSLVASNLVLEAIFVYYHNTKATAAAAEAVRNDATTNARRGAVPVSVKPCSMNPLVILSRSRCLPLFQL